MGGTHNITATYSGDGNFLDSTKTLSQVVTCSTNLSGNLSSLSVPVNGSVCLSNATVAGSITVASGGVLSVVSSTIGGKVTATAPGAVSICGSRTGATVSVTNATKFVILGDPFDRNCPVNTFGGTVIATGNAGGVEIAGNTINGSLTADNNLVLTEIGANSINAALGCSGNNPAPVNDGRPNRSAARTGQCGAAGF
ncbi:MAG: hypothetical protein JWP02_3859 [Acidimicrobiales bacterium]|nr:hypothetical protein [Acidimicrobiales bacterium]